MSSTIDNLKNINLYELLNCLISKVPEENPVEYFDKMYATINPGMIIEAVETAKKIVDIEGQNSKKSKKKKERAEVYLTLGGDSLNKSFYTGIIAALMWLPNYIRDVSQKLQISNQNMETCLNVLKDCKLPQIHDIKEEVVYGDDKNYKSETKDISLTEEKNDASSSEEASSNNTETSSNYEHKIVVKPSNVKHYSAFLGSIVSWLSSGVTSFTVKDTMKTNLEMCRYLTSAALSTFPSVPFCSYHIGTVDTTDIFNLSEKIGKSFDWTQYMSNECYILNEPKFVVTTNNAPIVGIVGHPLTETFIAEIKENQAKWVGLFIETEEFGKLCATNGLSAEMIKKYIIGTSEKQHSINIREKDPIAMFIENQKLTKQCFEWRHKYSSVKLEDDYKEAFYDL